MLLSSADGFHCVLRRFADTDEVFSPALVELFRSHDRAVQDYIAFRRDLEGLAAARAARLGSDTDLALVDTIFAKMVHLVDSHPLCLSTITLNKRL